MRFISLFAGVGGFDLGMERAGHTCVAQVEWNKNAAGVLKHRWPHVPLFCDVEKVEVDDLPDCDFITYGFPCQDLSVAGKRKGLKGERSGLFFEACRLIRGLAGRAIRRGGANGGRFLALAENVPGIFSAGDGVDFTRCLRELLNVGAGEVGWSVLDTQYVGWSSTEGVVRAAPQRRRRVFISSTFGSFGEGAAGEVFSQRSRLCRDSCESPKSGKNNGPRFRGGFTASSFGKYEQGVGTLRSQGGDLGGGSETLVAADVYNGEVTGDTTCTVTTATGISNASGPKILGWNGDPTPKHSDGVSLTLRASQGGEGMGVAHISHGSSKPCDVSPPLMSHCGPNRNGEGAPSTTEFTAVRRGKTVRRFMPVEAERLQSFPDGHTLKKEVLALDGNEWKATGKVVEQADGPRYAQLGNAVTVNVAHWLGLQISKLT